MDKRQILIIVALAAALLAVAAVVIFAGAGHNSDSDPESAALNSDASMTVTALKCGAADAFVIIKDGHAAVIDCGERDDGSKITGLLKLNGIEAVDILIITHFDKDHVGGAAEVIKNLDVKSVYVTYLSKDSDQIDDYLAACESKGLTPVTITEKTQLSLSGAELAVYPPEKDDYGNDTSNNSSLAVMLRDGGSGRSMFFTGDAENARLKELVKLEDDLSCDVLKVPHHGRYHSRLVDLVKRCSPEYAVITSSASDPEDTETLETLESAGAKVYLTKDGMVTFEFRADGITVKQ